MGILNLTEDSFYDGGRYLTDEAIVRRARQILDEGASIIDLGAVSTRPGTSDVPAEEEWPRIERALKLVLRDFPDAVISIDTWRADVAQRAIDAGASIINDVSGGTFDTKMPDVIGKMNVPYVLMHTTAKPELMQQTLVGEDMIPEITSFFETQLALFRDKGSENIILDPGFGFGKSLEQNYQLMSSLSSFQKFNLPILVGISRKSMIYKFLEITPDSALNGTTVLNTVALLKGASILRVHDVREAVESVKIIDNLKRNNRLNNFL